MAIVEHHNKHTTTLIPYDIPVMIVAAHPNRATLIFDHGAATFRITLNLPEIEELIRKLGPAIP